MNTNAAINLYSRRRAEKLFKALSAKIACVKLSRNLTVHKLVCSLIPNSLKLSFSLSYSASIKLLLMWILHVDDDDDQMMMRQIIMTMIMPITMMMFLVQAEF